MGVFVAAAFRDAIFLSASLLVTTLFFALLPGERAVSPDKLADSALTALLDRYDQVITL